MSKLITDTAQMQCTLGSMPAQIKVTSQTFLTLAGKLLVTEKDNAGMVNIPSFGTCKCSFTHPPCVPQPQAWQQTEQKNDINGAKNLNEQSFCMCAKGGKITFNDTGENTFVDGE